MKSFLRTTLFSISLFGLSFCAIPGVSALEILATNYSMNATSSKMTAQELCETANLVTTDPSSGVTWACSSANLDTTKAGRYSINIRANDGSNSELKTIQVRVKANVSNTAPVLELTQSSVTIYKGDEINLNSFIKTATDAEDGNLTPTITKNLDTGKAGVYSVTYTITDAQGLKDTKKLTVKVIAKSSESNEAETIVVDNNQTEQAQTTVENTSAVENRQELPSTADTTMINLGIAVIGLAAIGTVLFKRKRELVD
jgi:LPXTG-motif cell wall-anchored protein